MLFLQQISSMKIRFVSIIFVLIVSLHAWSQFINAYPQISGQGGAGVADLSHAYIDVNPAVVAWIEEPTIHTNYFARFLLTELSDENITFIYPLKNKQGTFSGELLYTGFSALHTVGTKINFAKQFGEKFSLGLNFDYFQLATDQEYYGRKNSFTFEAGAQYKLNEKLILGTYLFNPIQPKLSVIVNERIPLVFVTGAAYRFNDNFVMLADIKKIQKQEPTGHVGFRYSFSSKVQLQTGTSLNPFGIHAGSIFTLQKLHLSWSIQYQPILGFSSGIGIMYALNRQPKNSSYE